MELRLDGRGALVTGGSRGIGRAVSRLLARIGARVCVGYVGNAAAAEETVESIRSTGGEAFAVKADLADPAEAGRLVAAAASGLGAIDVLVVAHGIWKRAPIDEMTPEQWDETIRVNLGGAYAVCHHVARHMIPRRSGAIVTIASTSGQRGEAFYSHYSAERTSSVNPVARTTNRSATRR
jgi:3-oxoacyl-[acyl-carrier protein] reductase